MVDNTVAGGGHGQRLNYVLRSYAMRKVNTAQIRPASMNCSEKRTVIAPLKAFGFQTDPRIGQDEAFQLISDD
jgi:hypothetical protein